MKRVEGDEIKDEDKITFVGFGVKIETEEVVVEAEEEGVYG